MHSLDLLCQDCRLIAPGGVNVLLSSNTVGDLDQLRLKVSLALVAAALGQSFELLKLRL